MQGIIKDRGIVALTDILQELKSRKFLLVSDSSFPYLNIDDFFNSIGIPFVRFSDFTPNPLYEDVCKGVGLFNRENCDTIVAVGGGSTIDVAKCIKLYCKMDDSVNYLEQEAFDSGIPLIAVPTTAGTGSESTRHAVIYYEGAKQSISHPSIVPDCAVLEPSFLRTLPAYQKKCTMFDALCQAIESWWSVNSTDESKGYSGKALAAIKENWEEYIFKNTDQAAEKIMEAANYAGRAINITATTAAHAMSYKITSMYGLPHGHAVAVCIPEVWGYMLEHTQDCIDDRGTEYLKQTLDQIAEMIDLSYFKAMLEKMEMGYPVSADKDTELESLTRSVNPVRLKNNPVALSKDVLREMYRRILI